MRERGGWMEDRDGGRERRRKGDEGGRESG